MAIITVEKNVKPPDHQMRLNITQLVNETIAQSGLTEGFVVVQTKHTTTALLLGVQEDERYLMNDLLAMFEKLAPRNNYYQHNDFDIRTENIGPDERKNAAAHLKAFFVNRSPAVTATFRNGQLNLGQWQSILLFDFDPEDRPFRTLVIQLHGEKRES